MKKRRLHLDKELITISDPTVDGGRFTIAHPTCWWIAVSLQVSDMFCDDMTIAGCPGTGGCDPTVTQTCAPCTDTITCQPYSAC